MFAKLGPEIERDRSHHNSGTEGINIMIYDGLRLHVGLANVYLALS